MINFHTMEISRHLIVNNNAESKKFWYVVILDLLNMKKVIAYVHSHWDREWYREFQEFRLRLIEVFNKVLDDLESGSIPAFYFDAQTAALEDYLEIFPEKTTKVKQLIADKKLFIGPFYCSTDSFLTSSESMIRNLYFGMKKSKEFGETDFIGYLADTFGHSRSIAYVLKHFGIDKAILWRGLGDLPADIKWEGIDVLYLIQGYFQDFLNLDDTVEQKTENLKKYIDKIAAKSSDYILLPIGADHLATPLDLNNQIAKINNNLTDYHIELKTPFEYFEKTKNSKKKNVSGEFLDNSLNFILPGVYSSRIYLKQQNAQAQWRLSRRSEPLQAFTAFAFDKENRQNQTDYAFKTLVKNHAHDSIYGCSVDQVHKDMMTRFSNIRAISDGIEKRCIRDLSTDTDKISIVNLSNFEYSGIVKIRTTKDLPEEYEAQVIHKEKNFPDEKLYDIQQIPITEDITDMKEYLIDIKNIPAFSIKTIEQNDIYTVKHLKTYANKIENEFVSLEIKNGTICVVDKVKKQTYKDFINIIDMADIGDSYNFGALVNDKPIFAKIKSYELGESSSKRAVLKINYEINIPNNSRSAGRTKKALIHKMELKAVLFNQSKYIEFEMGWNNKSKNHLLQAEFNLKAPIISTVSEDALGLLERTFNPDYDIYKDIPAPRGIELKPNTAPMQRFVWAQNLGVVTDGLNEYEIHKNSLRLTILRSIGVISNHKNPTRGTPAGPPIPTPDLQCLGENKVRFAFAFAKKPDDLFKISENFYNSNVAVFNDNLQVKLLNTNNSNVLVYAVKLAENDLIVRLFNTLDKSQTINLTSDVKINKIYEVSPTEEVIKEITSKIEFTSKEIKTVRLVK